MDLDALRIFYKAAELEQITATAKYFGKSQGAISDRLRRLEKDLKTKLYKVGKDGISLTPAGEALFKKAKRIISDVEIAQHNIRELSGDNINFKVSTTHPFISHFLMDTLASFSKEHSNVDISMTYNDTPLDLIVRDTDVAIRSYITEKDSVHMEQIPLTTIRMKLFASKEYLKRNGTPEKISDLENHIIVMPEDEMFRTDKHYDWFSTLISKQIPKHKRATLKFSPSQFMQKAIELGMGIGTLSEEMVKVDDINVINVLGDVVTHEIDLYYTCLKDIKDDPYIVSLYEILKEYLEKMNNPSTVN